MRLGDVAALAREARAERMPKRQWWRSRGARCLIASAAFADERGRVPVVRREAATEECLRERKLDRPVVRTRGLNAGEHALMVAPTTHLGVEPAAPDADDKRAFKQGAIVDYPADVEEEPQLAASATERAQPPRTPHRDPVNQPSVRIVAVRDGGNVERGGSLVHVIPNGSRICEGDWR